MRKTCAALLGLFLLGCATTPYNYENYRKHHPKSILVLPPLNNSTDVRGTYGYLSTVTMPVAEKGYYVFPVGVVDQLMKENGLPDAHSMHQVPLKKLSEIIDPDAVLYLTLEEYGTKYVIIDSETTVAVSGRLVDARTGTLLWEGRAVGTDTGGSSHDPAVRLISAVVKQAVNSSTDAAHEVSRQANASLFGAPERGLLEGPSATKTVSRQ